MGLVQIIIDDSTNKIITGTYTFDRDNGGTLEIPHGVSFPSNPQANEIFWRDDEAKLYKRNATNTAWEVIVALPDPHASTHENGGSDVIQHQNLSGAGINTHAQIDSHIADRDNPHQVTKEQVGLGNVTNDAQLKRAAGDFASFAVNALPAADDIVLTEDYDDSWNKKKVSLGAIVETTGADAHQKYRHLIHYIDEGPAEGIVAYPGLYKEVKYSGVFPAQIIWWDSPNRDKKIVEIFYTWVGPKITQIVWKMYDHNGLLVRTLTDQISYSGMQEIYRTRIIS